ncbi:ankyrin repeat and SOCS box protein 10 [Salarias fasciatus]|uniref:ankyrin repeat and SOCS box protein 10 n=1 Tax=Salarias fasciatus TaxID=181472 RepID=UPI001176705C|nr:ankyrin repeat and SOCS box protein 10 [Salarias fasciatus]
MAGRSFVFTSSALRSLQRDQDLLDRDRHRRQLAEHRVSSYVPQWAREPPGTGSVRPPVLCEDVVVHNALYTGDLQALQRLFPAGSSADVTLEPRGGDMRWVPAGDGLWSLTYEQELTTPLHVAAGRGFADCLKHLLQRGADVDRAPGGSTALHESCDSCQPECTKLLLMYGADANAMTDDGLMPLHVCTEPQSLECARYLLQFGAVVGARSAEEDDTPLHVAARGGLADHVDLYLRYGAPVDPVNREGLTPLNAACAQPQEARDLPRYFQVCKRLLEGGADARTMDQDRRTPLHLACKSANPDVVELLLAKGACVNDMDYGGEAPLHNILKVVCFKVDHQPHRIVRALLNYGSIRVWPGALPKVLQHCSPSPRTIEVLLNAYSRLKVTEAWREAVPAELLEEHPVFFQSVFSLQDAPRSLQHLSRCRLRSFLEGRVHEVVPKLELPDIIRKYLLLEYRGYVH